MVACLLSCIRREKYFKTFSDNVSKLIDFCRYGVDSDVDFLKVVRLVFWSGVVGPGFRSLALRARSLALRARTIALRAHSRATRSKARLVSKSNSDVVNASINAVICEAQKQPKKFWSI